MEKKQMKTFWGQELPILDGTAYEKVCIAVEHGEIGAYISDCKYQSIYPGDKSFPICVEYEEMLSGILRYLDEHPEQEAVFSNAFMEEIRNCPRLSALITLIEMLGTLARYYEEKRFLTDELVTEMAKQIESVSDRLEAVTEPGLGHPYRREKLEFLDRYVYKLYGIHLVKP